jgi:hypothetical protein
MSPEIGDVPNNRIIGLKSQCFVPYPFAPKIAKVTPGSH